MDSSHGSSHGSSHDGADHRLFRQITRDRLLQEMLKAARTGKASAEWKVLIMDEVTVKVMSCSCKMADITDEGISLVEDLNKRRQPLPALEAVYFIQPSHDSVRKFMQDMSGKAPLYKKAYVFFSSPINRNLLQLIKGDQSVLSRVGALREMNLEYLAIDSQGFTTDNDIALEQLFGEHGEGTRDYDSCIETIAVRLSTVFASLKEFPYVRYRAPRSLDASTTTTARDLVPTKVAAVLWDKLMKYKASLLNFPQSETCDLLIVDRSIDPVAAVIHEWSYDALCHDLLELEGNKYSYEVMNGSRKERKEVLLEEHDPIWVELRDLFIADVLTRLPAKLAAFTNKNKAAQLQLGAREGQELSTRDMQKLVQALPQYRDQIEKLSLHTHIATVLNTMIKQDGLMDIGNLEQEFVYGDATTKELIGILNSNPEMSSECKLRLLMIYAATHPDKLDASKRLSWQKLAKLTDEEMSAVNNLEYLGVQAPKKQTSSGVEKFALKFGARKPKRPARKAKEMDEDGYQLSRFYPLLQDVVEEIDKGTLSKEEYPYVKDPAGSSYHSSSSQPGTRPPVNPNSKPVQSRRTVGKTGGSTWASKGRASSEDGYSSDSVLRHAVSDPKINGKRIFVFIIGGMTRSELRVAHKLTPQLRREVVVGSTNIGDPHQFIRKMQNLSRLDIDDF
ncbi:hypothetical protein KC19_2G009300 [Ceratodon purpureus]|uniref:Uncharacterized protein n=1 Tax=Ceratodon purpureus TaxID=3225 RepID=A0A8T0IQT3_CERPU|nr:hypothetical protein KC19_2G009300 [Ceratodon purpureus]